MSIPSSGSGMLASASSTRTRKDRGNSSRGILGDINDIRNGSVSRRRIRPMTELVLTDYVSIRDAFRRRSLAQALYDSGGVLMSGVLLTLHGDEHLRRRRIENRLFRRGTFRFYEREYVPSLIAETFAPYVV